MEQKRKIKSLLPVRIDWKSWFLTTLLLSLSVVMCVMSVSLMISRAEAVNHVLPDDLPKPNHGGTVGQEVKLTGGMQGYVYLTDLTYDWAINNEVEVVYAMRFMDPGNFLTPGTLTSTRFVNNIYMSGKALYVTPNPVIVNPYDSIRKDIAEDNKVWSGVCWNVLWWKFNGVYSDNITLIAWRDNEVVSWNDNAAVLWWVGNKFGPWKDGWNPMVVIWWSGNIMWTGHDGNALIWWENNVIWENTSNVFILGWKNNVVSSGVKNVIVWWKNVVVSGISNVFAFSNFDENFYPLSPNAFYLNLSKGVGIGMDRDYIGMSVNGAINLGEIDIKSVTCNTGNRWVLWSYSGCLFWCVDSKYMLEDDSRGSMGLAGVRILLNRGDKCRNLCRTTGNIQGEIMCQTLYFSGAYDGEFCGDQWGGGWSSPTPGGQQVHVNEPLWWVLTAQYLGNTPLLTADVRILTWIGGRVYPYITIQDRPFGYCTDDDFIDVVNATNCDGSGAESLYSSSVVFETSLIDSDDHCPTTWENRCVYKCNSGNHLVEVSWTYKCQPNCQMHWADGTERETFRAGEKTVWFKVSEVDCVNSGGVNTSTCADYKKTLVCQNWRMYVEWSKFTAESMGYVYSRCKMNTFQCNVGYYDLLSGDIWTRYSDTIGTSNLSGKTEVVWTRGTYEVCLDYQWRWEESCEVGISRFKFKFCNSWYSLVDGKCMKDCTWKENGDTKHWIWRMFYTTWSVACPGACSGQLFTCNDGNWSWANKAVYTHISCDYTPKICDENYNVTFVQYQQQRSGYWQYESCENIAVTDNVCTWNNSVYKLVGCNTWRHTDDGRTCVSNTGFGGDCSGNPQNSEWINGGTYTKTWSWTWNTGEWISNSGTDCQWVCESGYHEDDGVCISNEMMACVAPAGWNTGTWEWEIPTYTWNGGSYPRPTYVGNADDDSECVYKCSGSGYTWFVYNVYDDAKGCVSCFDYCSQGTYKVRDVFYYHSGRCYENTGGKTPNLDGSCDSGFDLDNGNGRLWCYPECQTP